jgi:hypothetical protein
VPEIRVQAAQLAEHVGRTLARQDRELQGVLGTAV